MLLLGAEQAPDWDFPAAPQRHSTGPCTGRPAPGLWGGDGLCKPWQGVELGTGRHCWQEQPCSAETSAGRDRELLPEMLGRGMWHLPAVPVVQTSSPSNSYLSSFPILSRASALIPWGLECALPLQQPEPREGQAPDFYQSVCLSSPARSIVAFHCHPQVPVLSLFPPLGFLSQCKGLGVTKCLNRHPLDPAVEMCLKEQSTQIPSGAIQLSPWVSCRAAGCSPERHSSTVVSLGCLGSPQKRQLSGRARERLLGSCTWAGARIPLCSSLAGDS